MLPAGSSGFSHCGRFHRAALMIEACRTYRQPRQPPGNKMIFASDNWAGAHPKIAASLSANASGFAEAYGTSAVDRAAQDRFNEIFEREVAVFFVATGTAANSLALTSVNRPGGIAFAHREAHMIVDEYGAPGYFTGGSRVFPVDGALGRLDPASLGQ